MCRSHSISLTHLLTHSQVNDLLVNTLRQLTTSSLKTRRKNFDDTKPYPTLKQCVDYIWIDTVCVPSHEKFPNLRHRAMRSVPAYVSLCEYTVVISPNGLRKWRQRAQSRLDVFSTMLSIHKTNDLLVVQDKDTSALWCEAYDVMNFGRISDSKFSCCNGPPAVCDKGKTYCERSIARRLMRSIIETKAAKLFTQGHATLARFFLCARRFWSGLEEEQQRTVLPDLQWRGLKDIEIARRKGWSKLLFSVIAGVDISTFDEDDDDINRPLKSPFEAEILELEFRDGMTPLDVAMKFLAPIDVVTTLLKKGARSSSTVEEWLCACPARSLGEHAKHFCSARLDVVHLMERGDRDRNMIELLLQDDVDITDDTLKIAIQNEGIDHETIRLILKRVTKRSADVAVVKPRHCRLVLSYPWRKRDPRVLLRGGNALHVACSVGDVETVRMLLLEKFDVNQRTRLGNATSIEIAEAFGSLGTRLREVLKDASPPSPSNSSSWFCGWL